MSSEALVSFAISGILTGAQMLVPERRRRSLGWCILTIFCLTCAYGTYSLITGPKVVVTISRKQSEQLGIPYPAKPLVDKSVYQGIYENGIAIWVDGHFFELGPDHQFWASFADPTPTNDLRWFKRAPLKKDFPQCGDRLPVAGVAKAMLGPQKQYYAWLGCLSAANSASTTLNAVTIQQFTNGYVIEGILDPPQSSYRNRFILINGGPWESELIDQAGKFYPVDPWD